MDINIKQTYRKLDASHQDYMSGLTKWLELHDEYSSLEPDDPARIIIKDELDSLDQMNDAHYEKVKSIRSQIDAYNALYHRPNGKVNGIFSRMLGPLPVDLKALRYDPEEMKDIPRYRFLPLLLAVWVLVLIGVALAYMPVLRISPFTLMASSASVGSSGQSIVLQTISVIVVVAGVIFMVASRRFASRMVHEMALYQEQWFRAGAENWSTRQRIMSCVSFGACHIVNIIYPVVTVCVLMLAGAVLMAVYLAEYRRSHDTERAIMASTRFHAMYNLYAFMILFAIVGSLFVASIF